MNIPLVDLGAQYQPLKDEIIAGMEQALEGMHLFLGRQRPGFRERVRAVLRREARNRRE